MLKNIVYPRTLVALIVIAAVAAWQVYAGWAPLLAWLVLVVAQMSITGILIYNARISTAKVPHPQSGASSDAQLPANLKQAIELANAQTDEKGQPTPRLPAGMFKAVGSGVASQVRAYASVEDAQSYGWSFSEQIGDFNDQPIFGLALLEGQKWEYDGLVSPKAEFSIPADRRVFGRLRYRAVVPQDTTADGASVVENKPSTTAVANTPDKVGSDIPGVSTT